VTTSAGWYADPWAPETPILRWWDGSAWTPHVSQPTQALQTSADRIVRLPDGGRQRVAGESFNQPALQQICAGRQVPYAPDWDNALAVTARLVAEPDNPYDKNAVRVDVFGRQVGHLFKEDAPILHSQLVRLNKAGWHAECAGRIVIANNGLYAIYLHVQDLAEIAEQLAAHQVG
jgi:hypothetical protein